MVISPSITGRLASTFGGFQSSVIMEDEISQLIMTSPASSSMLTSSTLPQSKESITWVSAVKRYKASSLLRTGPDETGRSCATTNKYLISWYVSHQDFEFLEIVRNLESEKSNYTYTLHIHITHTNRSQIRIEQILLTCSFTKKIQTETNHSLTCTLHLHISLTQAT